MSSAGGSATPGVDAASSSDDDQVIAMRRPTATPPLPAPSALLSSDDATHAKESPFVAALEHGPSSSDDDVPLRPPAKKPPSGQSSARTRRFGVFTPQSSGIGSTVSPAEAAAAQLPSELPPPTHVDIRPSSQLVVSEPGSLGGEEQRLEQVLAGDGALMEGVEEADLHEPGGEPAELASPGGEGIGALGASRTPGLAGLGRNEQVIQGAAGACAAAASGDSGGVAMVDEEDSGAQDHAHQAFGSEIQIEAASVTLLEQAGDPEVSVSLQQDAPDADTEASGDGAEAAVIPEVVPLVGDQRQSSSADMNDGGDGAIIPDSEEEN